MTDQQIKRLRELLTKLKKAHLVYKNCSEEQKGRLFDQCGFLFDELVTFGRERPFYEALLMFGNEFLLSEYGDEEEKLFGAFKEPMTSGEIEEAHKQWKDQQRSARAGVASPLVVSPSRKGEEQKAAQLGLSDLPSSVDKS